MSEIPTQPKIVDNPIDQDENEEDEEHLIEELEGENVDADQENEYQIQTRSATRANIPREVKNLNTFYNPTLITAEEQTELMLISTSPSEPVTFQDAWNHPVNEKKRGWQEAILKELTDMDVKRKIWIKAKI